MTGARVPAASQPDPLYLVLSETLFRTVVKLGRARALVRRHFLRVLECTTVGQIGGDAGGAERVAADCLGNVGGGGTAPDHAQASGWPIGFSDSVCLYAREQWKEPAFPVINDPSRADIGAKGGRPPVRRYCTASGPPSL